ncbi:MAG: DNA repair protein RadA [Bacteroidia bacterium]|nr:DNA repair protein RadA [Bacteroidia bacterium]
MSKIKTAFVCQSCGFSTPKWMGKCSSCGAWNSFVEEIQQKSSDRSMLLRSSAQSSRPQKLEEVRTESSERISTRDAELDRVLGGGMVPGSVILLGGEPGIGKSTLLLQTVLKLQGKKILYISGEESEAQIKLRAERTPYRNSDCYVLTETNLEQIIQQIEALQPEVVIADSIQTLHTEFIESSAGSVSQIRECASKLIRYAKATGTPTILVGHINKEGSIAGPKILEHMVDVVLQFEGDRNHIFRIIRAMKNRFGSTSEIGIYEMKQFGLEEVPNPSALLLSESDLQLSGTTIAAITEGLRPLLVEVQALVSTAVYGTPQRAANGFDVRRLNMLLAVLEKRCGFHLGTKDVFLNVTGGIRLEEPAADLSVVAAILSSNEDLALPRNVCFAGEVGLTGEIRPVSRIEARIAEAQKLGFERIFVAQSNLKGLSAKNAGMQVSGVSRIEDLYRQL